MKQLFTRKGDVSLHSVPDPGKRKNAVLVMSQYSLISAGTELSTIDNTKKNLFQMAKKNPENVAKVLKMIREKGIKNTYRQVRSVLKGFYNFGSEIGYSTAGVVIDIGDNINDIKIGDRVACAGSGIASHAEINAIPRNLLVKMPDKLDFKKACSVTLGAIALQGVRQADPRLGENVAVIGLGLLGQITIQLLKASGCRVIGSDIDSSKIELARELCIDKVVNNKKDDFVKACDTFSDGKGVDAVIITAATQSSELINQSMKICRRKGRVVIVGAVGLHLQREDFYKKEIDLKISTSYGPGRYDDLYEQEGQDYPYGYVRWTENRNMQEYLRLVMNGDVNFEKLITQEYNFEDAEKAYHDLQDPNITSLAVILKYPKYEESKNHSGKSKIINLPPIQFKNERIRVGLIGCGGFASGTHLPNLQKLDKLYSIYAVADLKGSSAQKMAHQFEACYATSDTNKIFQDKNIDLVIISTRHINHAELVIEGLRHQKMVFVEKPLAVNQQQLKDIIVEYQKYPRPLMVGFNRRFSPFIKKIKYLMNDRTNPLIINYRMNAGYIPLEHWVHTNEGGGRIIGEGCHIIDLFKYLVGNDHTNVQAASISSPSDRYSYSDNVVTTISYNDGSVCNLIYTAMGSDELMKEYMDVFCEGRVYSLYDYKELRVLGGSGSMKRSNQEKGHVEELEAFARAVKHKQQPIPFEDLVETTKITFKINDLIKVK